MNTMSCDNDSVTDYGRKPYVTNINVQAIRNRNYRTALWTGENLQLTLMSIPVGSDIGVEMHDDTDQFIRIVNGRAMVQFGDCREDLKNAQRVDGNYAVFVPAGTWHNIVNIGNTPLKLYSIYAPPHHPFGTIQKRKG